jgi:hypothetical protein
MLISMVKHLALFPIYHHLKTKSQLSIQAYTTPIEALNRNAFPGRRASISRPRHGPTSRHGRLLLHCIGHRRL